MGNTICFLATPNSQHRTLDRNWKINSKKKMGLDNEIQENGVVWHSLKKLMKVLQLPLNGRNHGTHTVHVAEGN